MGGKSGGSGQITGYRYFLAMLMGICRGPVDAIVAIKAENINIWPGTPVDAPPTFAPTGNVSDNTSFQISSPNAFGGDQKEGGVAGIIDAQMGADDQDLTGSAFQAMVQTGQDLRGVATMFFRGGDIIFNGVDFGTDANLTGLAKAFIDAETAQDGGGQIGGLITSNTPYPKPWSVRVRRTLKGWFGGTAWYPEEAIIELDDGLGNLIQAMNPAHMLYECLTNPVWGRGLVTALLDEVSFISAANTLCREKFGMCMAWTREQELGDFIQTIINHVGAAIYLDRTSGLLVLKLIRQDYVASDLPVFDYTSGLLSIDDDETTSPDNSHSEIIVNWVDPVQNNKRQTRVQNLAGTQANQSIASTSVDYLGLPTSQLAARVAQRDLSIQGSGIKRYTLILDRRGRKITPAGVFRINVPDRNISNMVLRCGTIEEGSIDNQTIKVVALQDVFGLEATTYLGEPERTWAPPDRSLHTIDTRRVSEINYRDTVRILSPGDLAVVEVTSGTPVAVAQAPSTNSIHYELETHGSGESYVDHGSFGWAPYAKLETDIGYYDTTMTITVPTGFSNFGTLPTTAWIDNEIVIITAADTTGPLIVFTIGRGTIDTIPAPHNAGTDIWFPDNSQSSDGRHYTTGETVDVKLLTRTTTAILDITVAAEDELTIIGRQGLPYPPGDFKIGGNPFASVTTQTGDDVFTWAHRDRITQSDHILVHQDASTGPETDTTYQTDIYQGLTLLRATTGITDDNWTYDTTMATADGDPSHIIIHLRSERDGLLSMQEYVWSFYRVAVGYGHGYGNRYG